MRSERDIGDTGAAVDEVLVSGASYRAVALAFGLNLSAIFRHANNHLAAPIRRRPGPLTDSDTAGAVAALRARCAGFEADERPVTGR